MAIGDKDRVVTGDRHGDRIAHHIGTDRVGKAVAITGGKEIVLAVNAIGSGITAAGRAGLCQGIVVLEYAVVVGVADKQVSNAIDREARRIAKSIRSRWRGGGKTVVALVAVDAFGKIAAVAEDPSGNSSARGQRFVILKHASVAGIGDVNVPGRIRDNCARPA